MRIRLGVARPRDALPLLALQRDVLAEGQWFVTDAGEFNLDVEDKEAWIEDHYRSANSVIYVARSGPAIFGMCSLTGGRLRRLRHTAKLEIMVAKNMRGEGLGAQLLAEAISWAEANPELEKLGLAVFDDNPRAIHLYERHGFAIEGRRAHEYRMDDGSYRGDLLMERWVSSTPRPTQPPADKSSVP